MKKWERKEREIERARGESEKFESANESPPQRLLLG